MVTIVNNYNNIPSYLLLPYNQMVAGDQFTYSKQELGVDGKATIYILAKENKIKLMHHNDGKNITFYVKYANQRSRYFPESAILNFISEHAEGIAVKDIIEHFKSNSVQKADLDSLSGRGMIDYFYPPKTGGRGRPGLMAKLSSHAKTT